MRELRYGMERERERKSFRVGLLLMGLSTHELVMDGEKEKVSKLYWRVERVRESILGGHHRLFDLLWRRLGC